MPIDVYARGVSLFQAFGPQELNCDVQFVYRYSSFGWV